jgi:hypothetical protein
MHVKPLFPSLRTAVPCAVVSTILADLATSVSPQKSPGNHHLDRRHSIGLRAEKMMRRIFIAASLLMAAFIPKRLSLGVPLGTVTSRLSRVTKIGGGHEEFSLDITLPWSDGNKSAGDSVVIDKEKHV